MRIGYVGDGEHGKGRANMGETESLTARQRRFVAALLAAPTVLDAAAAASISETTAWRYLASPAVQAELSARCDVVLTQVSAGLVADMQEARAVLVEAMRDPEAAPGVRVRAALGVLDAGLRVLDSLLLARRVAVLETRLEGGDDGQVV